MERNKIQKEKRESLNYTFKDLKNLTKIPIFRLKDIENGLAYPRKKEKIKLIEALHISKEDYDENSDLHYPYLFKKEEKANKITNFLFTKVMLIVSILFSIIFSISLGFSIRECIPHAYNIPSFYDENLIQIREDLIKKSAKVHSNYVFSITQEDAKIDYIFNENINYISDSKINYSFTNENYYFVFSFSADSFERLLTVYVKNEISGTTFTYFYFLNYLEEDLYFDHEIINEENIIESLEITPLIETYFPDIYNTIQNGLKTNYSISLGEYLDYLKNGQYACYSHESEFYYISFFIFLALLISLSTLSINLHLTHKNKIPEIKQKETKYKEHKTLKKDIALTPFIQENWLIIFSQIFYFIASFSLYLSFANMFEINNINTISNIETIIDVLKNCLPIANILILFLNLNRKIINNRPLKTALSYLFIGTIFTSLECILIFDLSRADDFFLNIIISFFPKNLFFAMGLYALIYYFLFHESNNLNQNKTKKILFRLSSTPLLLFLFFSLIYPQLTNAGIVERNLYLNSFLASIDFSFSFLALGFIFVKKIIDLCFLYIYGEINFSKYQRGNRYQFIMNIIFIALLLITFIIALSYINDGDMQTVLGLENFIYVPCLIPFIFFFKKRLDERNIIVDSVSSFAFFTSNVLSYLLIFLTITA